MSVLKIIEAPDPILKKVSEPIKKVDDELRALMDNMLDTMYHAQGVGLAAVQVGVHKRILVMDVDYGSSRYREGDSLNGKNPLYLVNPEIIKESEEQNIYEEGCLSFPGQYAEITRPKRVTVKYLDYHGKEQTLSADELLSTCVQHEIDHLNGVTFVDHLSRLKRDMIIKKLIKVRK